MSLRGDKFMWLFVFFDLPVVEQEERREAAQFRKFLIKQGFSMLQFSVYVRVCNGDHRVSKHVEKIMHNLPTSGSIRSLVVTDAQYGRMAPLLGKKQRIEEKKVAEQLVLF